jgi:hypothetical protein
MVAKTRAGSQTAERRGFEDSVDLQAAAENADYSGDETAPAARIAENGRDHERSEIVREWR